MDNGSHNGELADQPRVALPRAYVWLGTLILAYIGVYLCRKNLGVAVPLMQQQWGVTKEQIGMVASVSTVAYACGKIGLGPVVDRLGGRFCLLSSMLVVALFCLLGAVATGIVSLTAVYSLNRLAASASWGSMVKLTPDWFSAKTLAFVMGLLSLSYVFGGACASAFAGLVAKLTGDNWHYILGAPSLVLIALALASARILPRASLAIPTPPQARPAQSGFAWSRILTLLSNPRFLVICALSFTLTLMRETFNFWTPDLLQTEGGPQVSSSLAALLATPFDVLGGVGIVALGWVLTRVGPRARCWVLFGILATLSFLLAGLPTLFHLGLWLVTLAIGLIGFLVYGPYSLLSGVLAVEVSGQQSAATAAGLVDGIGYLAGVLSGKYFGRLLGIGGYALGFQCMAGLTLLSAVLCLFLYPRPAPGQRAP